VKVISGVHKLIDGSIIHQLRFETISNNLANINTTGFKKDIIAFNEALSLQYVTQTDLRQGHMRHTGNSLDVALNCEGFFKIQTPGGIRYTRSGEFSLTSEGTLVTQRGETVLGEGGPIQIQGKNVEIHPNGDVVVDGQQVDKMKVVNFKSPNLLKKEGRSQYSYQGPEEEIIEPENLRVQHRYLEGSNVDLTQEMIKMVEAYRSYESAQKAIQTIDEMTHKMINDSGAMN
jgi:flagellar basal-body rod protein FlgG